MHFGKGNYLFIACDKALGKKLKWIPFEHGLRLWWLEVYNKIFFAKMKSSPFEQVRIFKWRL
jgi:hypothetical protein